MSDAPAWVAVGVSVAAFAWTAWVDRRARADKKQATTHQKQATVDSAISRVVAQWAVTRLKEISWFDDSILDELKQSAFRLRAGCREPLAMVSETSRAYELITEIVNAASKFEKVIDSMREGKAPADSSVGQTAITTMQSSIWHSINQLTALKGP